MNYESMMRLQKVLYLNAHLDVIWFSVTGIFMYIKLDSLDHLTKYLCEVVYALLLIIEMVRLYLGQYGNLCKRVPELAGFLMLTLLMQLPLVSFFTFNTHLNNCPTEIILNTLMWFLAVTELVFGFLSVKDASSFAKHVYLSKKK